MKKGMLVAIGLILFFTNHPILAQEYSEEKVVKYASSKLIEGLLENLDLTYEEINDGAYSFKMNGYKVILVNKGEDIQILAFFSGKKITLTRINEWNKTKRFSRAYLDDDGDAVLDADLDFEGGVTGETLLRFLKIFSDSVEAFSEHLD